jgi:hypothetical protein
MTRNAERYTTDQLAEALKATNGLVSLAARRVGISRSQFYTRIRNTRSLQEIIEDGREELVDLAEMALRSGIINKEPWAVGMALKSLGKKRGYVERQETEQSGEIVIRIKRDDNTND